MDVDPDLVRAVQRGEPGAMEELITATYLQVHRHCLRLLRDPSDAADATQEVFLRVTRSVFGFRGESSFGTWLYRVTQNVCSTALRRRGDAAARGALAGPDPFAVPGGRRDLTADDDVESDYLDAERTMVIHTALETLSDDDRAVIVLRDIQGLTTRQTAEALGISDSATKVRLHRAHARLRQVVGG
ncbi:MAG TPA: sigma-70 family RNA polymerase sigma factor [Nitriliruptorales bacterium]